MLSQEPEPGVAASLRCVGPQGFIFEVVAGVDGARPRAPDHQSTRVRRLQHATLFVTDLDELEDFLVTVLGFVKTDVVPGAVSWLRCGNDHHDLNLIHGDAPGYHHMGWEVDGLDDIGVMADHLAHHGRHLCWGPGRHAPGGVLFAYFRDDDGVLTEFCADIGNASGSDRSVREWPLSPFTANVWGVAAPADVHDLVVPIASRA